MTDADMFAADIDRLVVDSRLLQRYLANLGKLPDFSLGAAIDAMERARGTQDAGKRLAELSFQFSNAINLAKPVSLEKLRFVSARINSRGFASSARELFTAGVAVLLIFFAVLGFVIVQDINDNMVELQRINLQNPLQKLTELRRMIHEGALKDPKLAYYSQYLKAQNELSLMFDSANQILRRTAASTQRRSENDSGGSVSEANVGVASQIYNIILLGLAGPPPRSTAKVGSLPASPLAIGGTLENIQLDQSKLQIGEKDCKPYNNAPVKTLYGSENKQFLLAALDRFDDFCLAQTLDIRVGDYRPASAIYTVRVLQSQLFVIGVLFLPMIGGLLGATISLIYAIINKTRASGLSSSYMIVRIVVGGAFGVIIGWFSASGAGSSPELAQHVSGTPFTLAILAGFSIDTLSIVMQKFSKASTEEIPREKISI